MDIIPKPEASHLADAIICKSGHKRTVLNSKLLISS